MTTWILKYNTDCTILCSIYTTLHGVCGKLHLTQGIQTHGLARSYGWETNGENMDGIGHTDMDEDKQIVLRNH